MTSTEQALARELARHPDWTWQSGMMMLLDTGDVPIVYGRSNGTEERRDCVPDLSDPATQGCLAAALEPWILDVSRRMYMSDVRWTVTVFLSGRKVHSSAPTFGEAIARAWLAVKGKKPKL